MSSRYENFLLFGDFNAEPATTTVFNFSETYNFTSIIKDKTYFKNPSIPTCIDLMITNWPRSFKHSMVVKTVKQGYQISRKCVSQSWKLITRSRSRLLSNIVNSKNFPMMLSLKISKFDNDTSVTSVILQWYNDTTMILQL